MCGAIGDVVQPGVCRLTEGGGRIETPRLADQRVGALAGLENIDAGVVTGLRRGVAKAAAGIGQAGNPLTQGNISDLLAAVDGQAVGALLVAGIGTGIVEGNLETMAVSTGRGRAVGSRDLGKAGDAARINGANVGDGIVEALGEIGAVARAATGGWLEFDVGGKRVELCCIAFPCLRLWPGIQFGDAGVDRLEEFRDGGPRLGGGQSRFALGVAQAGVERVGQFDR